MYGQFDTGRGNASLYETLVVCLCFVAQDEVLGVTCVEKFRKKRSK